MVFRDLPRCVRPPPCALGAQPHLTLMPSAEAGGRAPASLGKCSHTCEFQGPHPHPQVPKTHSDRPVRPHKHTALMMTAPPDHAIMPRPTDSDGRCRSTLQVCIETKKNCSDTRDEADDLCQHLGPAYDACLRGACPNTDDGAYISPPRFVPPHTHSVVEAIRCLERRALGRSCATRFPIR